MEGRRADQGKMETGSDALNHEGWRAVIRCTLETILMMITGIKMNYVEESGKWIICLIIHGSLLLISLLILVKQHLILL